MLPQSKNRNHKPSTIFSISIFELGKITFHKEYLKNKNDNFAVYWQKI
ncbi:hypothetical protein MNB_SUP05-SYMBIONT-7-86 [hydrothermal vent metagenome]|uniref:Uncharacterized protein n=1 Tax=hydrothermal vent metagenome TaxID=652676 RepID=A0A1W1E2J3_9ZZZZ